MKKVRQRIILNQVNLTAISIVFGYPKQKLNLPFQSLLIT